MDPTEMANRTRKALRLANVADRIMESSGVAPAERPVLLGGMDDEWWTRLCEVAHENMPSEATRAAVRVVLEERHSGTDPFAGLTGGAR